MPRSYFFINLILLIIIVLLGFRLYKAWIRPLDIPTQTTQRQFQKDKKSPADRKEVNEAAYNVIVQKDLFRPSRTAAPRADSNRSSFPKNPPKLFGTMIINNENFAILENPSTKTTKLYHVNDSVAGFIVSEIQKDKVILLKGSEKIEVKLRDVKGFKSPASLHAPKPSRGPRKPRPRRPRTRKQPPPRESSFEKDD